MQAKSGTGKTVTFGAIVADSARADSPSPRVLVLEPTREVALQTHRIVASLCAELPSKARRMRRRDLRQLSPGCGARC